MLATRDKDGLDLLASEPAEPEDWRAPCRRGGSPTPALELKTANPVHGGAADRVKQISFGLGTHHKLKGNKAAKTVSRWVAMKKILLAIVLIAVVVTIGRYFLSMQNEGTGGFYIGELALKPLPDGRTMELLEPFSYQDSKGIQWGAPQGTLVDGASIPKPFWSFAGGPFSGKYRDASVIHDYYCDTKHRSWEAVHRVFHEAMRTSGVPKRQAALMFYAVYRFGPRWQVEKFQPECPPGVACVLVSGVGLEFTEESLPYIQSDLEEFQKFLERGSPDVESTEIFTKRQIQRLGSQPHRETSTVRRFYRYYRDFPSEYDFLLSERELRSVLEERN